MDLVIGPAPQNRPAIDRLRRQLTFALMPAEGDRIFVTEVRCQDAGCHDVETVVALWSACGTRRQHTFKKPAAQIEWYEVVHLAGTWFPVPGGAKGRQPCS
ncbi:MAG: hypothetical protein FJW21_00015 [Acidimicrobiia bacterium]|nr:hypothetical protein [Acidimicrobiia bacterium]